MTPPPSSKTRFKEFPRDIIDVIAGTLLVIMIGLGGWSLYTVDTLKDRVTVLESATNIVTQLEYVSKSIDLMRSSINGINVDIMQIKISIAKQGGG